MKKVLRFFLIYGLFRTIIKVAGRTRWVFLRFFFKSSYIHQKKVVSLIGCGQFGFATMSYFLQKIKYNCFLECFDIDNTQSETAANFWGYRKVDDVTDLINNPQCKYVYIASNHCTHTPYAIQAIRAGKIVYVEKPIAVTYDQLSDLLIELKKYPTLIYAGYNRPYSKAILQLRYFLKDLNLPFTLGCFISGHKIGLEHWYRKPEEGTRVCGNIGHWLDLSIHLFNMRGYIPMKYEINVIQSDSTDLDDNLTISYSTDYGDLVSITLTSREEPFEGINETINLQCGNVISKIDDFRKQQIWVGNRKYSYSYFPKDVGHARCILQPFIKNNRDFKEVIYSTLLMLKIKEMVLAKENFSCYDMLLDLERL